MDEEIEMYEKALNSIGMNQPWSPPYHNACYERTGEKEITLLFRSDGVNSQKMHDEITRTVELIGWEMIDLGGSVLPPEEAAHRIIQSKQDASRNWTCPTDDCEEYIATMPLEEAKWVNMGEQEMVQPDGQSVSTERWGTNVTCHACGQEIFMEPNDYAVIAGDDLFWTYKATNGVTYTMVSRESIVDLIDSGAGESLVLTGTFTPFCQDVFPPHMRGAPCLFVVPEGDEEE